ncbi:MAG: DNRLRE domain-containing protein, partial [Burkholderiaceae bacterium]
MSPMLLWKDTSKKLTVLFLVAMFLCADLLLPQTQDGWQVLEPENQVSHVISNHYVLADTYINESSPNSNYNSSDTGYLIPTDGEETRILLDFPKNFTSSDIIYNASVELTCTILSGQSTSEISVYPARMSQGWNSTIVSWSYYANNLLWGQGGADGASDRFDWEPPSLATSTGVLAINVTSLAQQAAKNNLGKLRLILAATGTSYACDLSETQNLITDNTDNLAS